MGVKTGIISSNNDNCHLFSAYSEPGTLQSALYIILLSFNEL